MGGVGLPAGASAPTSLPPVFRRRVFDGPIEQLCNRLLDADIQFGTVNRECRYTLREVGYLGNDLGRFCVVIKAVA